MQSMDFIRRRKSYGWSEMDLMDGDRMRPSREARETLTTPRLAPSCLHAGRPGSALPRAHGLDGQPPAMMHRLRVWPLQAAPGESLGHGQRALGRWPEPRLGGRAQLQQQQPQQAGPGKRATARAFLRPPASRLSSQASLSSRSLAFSSLGKESPRALRGLKGQHSWGVGGNAGSSPSARVSGWDTPRGTGDRMRRGFPAVG